MVKGAVIGTSWTCRSSGRPDVRWSVELLEVEGGGFCSGGAVFSVGIAFSVLTSSMRTFLVSVFFGFSSSEELDDELDDEESLYSVAFLARLVCPSVSGCGC